MPQGSVEIGEAHKSEGRIRRSFKSPDNLITSPSTGVNTVYDLLQNSVTKFPEWKAVGWRDVIAIHEEEKEVAGKTKKWQYFELGPYRWWTYQEFASLVANVGSGLKEVGLNPDKRFNIYSATSAHWQLLANGCIHQSISFATSYDSLGEEGLQHSISEPDVVGIFTNANLLGTLANVVSRCETLQVVIWDGKQEDVPKGSIEKIKESRESLRILHLDELIALGKEKPHDAIPPKPEDIACIMYTSGSTGPPKGVLMSHGNIVASVGAVELLLGELIRPGESYIGYLPLAHILEFVVEMCMLYVGVPIGYGTVKTLTESSVRNCLGDIREFRPTIMVGVPAVWELIRKGIMSKVKAGGSLKSSIFNGSVRAKKAGQSLPIPFNPFGAVTDAVVFKAVKQATGGRLKYALSGGAPISSETQEFLSIALVQILQGYGMTESCGMCAILPPKFMQYGSVGVPVPSIEIKLADVEEVGYFSSNNPPQGEVLIRGPSVTKGYFKRDDITRETITDDGWLMTGDIGQWNKDGTLSLIDRKKNLVKLSGGEYVALERLESVYKSAHLIANICVHASSEASKPMAIVSVNEPNFKSFLTSKGVGQDKKDDVEALCEDQVVQKTVLDELNGIGKRMGFKPLEQLQSVVLSGHEWTPQNGLLTAAQKLQRKAIVNYYQDQIKAVYP